MMGISKLLAGLVALMSVVFLLVVPNVDAQSQPVATVSIRDFYFEPAQLVVEPGTTVRWVNEGTTQHTVFATSPAGAFLSETLDPGESFTHTFPQRFPRPSPDRSTVQPGTFRYICKIHPDMKGRVVFAEAEPEGTTAPLPPPPPVQPSPTPVEEPPPPVQEPPPPPPVERPPTVPKTGGFSPILLVSGSAVALVVAVGVLGWVIKRRNS